MMKLCNTLMRKNVSPSAAWGQFPRSFLFFVTLAGLKNPVQVSCRMSATLGLSDVFSGLGWVEGGVPFSARPVRVTTPAWHHVGIDLQPDPTVFARLPP